MPNTNKFAVKNGLQAPNIDLVSPDGANTFTISVSNNDILSISGNAGQLFSITDSFSGTIFSVSDVSGIPSIEVLDTGLVKLAQYSGNVVIGTGTSNNVDKLQINGSVSGTVLKSTVASGTAPFTVNSTTVVANLNADLFDGFTTAASANGASTIVARDAAGSFVANVISILAADTSTAASHYYVETASDNAIRPKTLANVQTEVVTAASVNAISVLAGSATLAPLRYNGTTAAAGVFDGGSTAPSGTTRLNYGGNFYATNFFGNGSNLTGVGATLTNDTTTNASTYYPVLAFNQTSGALSIANTSSTKLYYNPSTGTLNSTVFNSLSDSSVKTDVKIITNSVDTINKISGVEFLWKETQQKSAGVIAQELESVIPHLVATDEKGMKSVNYNGIIAYLIQAVKELSSRVNELEQR